MSLDELVREMLAATEGPPPPREVRVARDLYDEMKARVAHDSDRRPTWTAPAIGALFGIPVVIDDELAPGEFRIVEGVRR